MRGDCTCESEEVHRDAIEVGVGDLVLSPPLLLLSRAPPSFPLTAAYETDRLTRAGRSSSSWLRRNLPERCLKTYDPDDWTRRLHGGGRLLPDEDKNSDCVCVGVCECDWEWELGTTMSLGAVAAAAAAAAAAVAGLGV
jgi:hypothetical protein